MDDKKLLDEIKNSAKDVEIPESLRPDKIKERLEAGEKDTIEEYKKKIIPLRRYAGWAAAFVVLLGAGLISAPFIRQQAAGGGEEVQMAPGVVEYPAEDADTADTEVLHVKSYEELYEILRQKPVDYVNEEMVIPETAEVVEERELASYDAGGTTEMAAAHPAANSGAGASGMETGDYSVTNTQDKNVDEADVVKTDGAYVYAMDSKGMVRIVDSKTLKLTGEIPFAGSRGAECFEMYVNGDTLQVIFAKSEYATVEDEKQALEGVRTYYGMQKWVTSVVTYDISRRDAPKITGTYTQDGRYLSSRRNGDYLYLFTSFTPRRDCEPEEKPYYVPRAGDSFIPVEKIFLPGTERNRHYDTGSYLVAGSVRDGEPGEPVDQMAIVSGAETFYVSRENIYSATYRWEGKEDSTEIVRLGYRDGSFSPGNCGSVPGRLNNNFSMDEHEGNLRVVTTVVRSEKNISWDGFWATSQRSNGLYVLDEGLQIIGKIENLAKDESIESARFMGDTGYFVTYRNVDPLFSVDLSDPENPKVLGELKITGFSEYLHFYGEDKLLGIGWETDPDTGANLGLKCSMFDLSDKGDVKEIDKFIMKDVAYCDALSQYKAILADPEKNLFGFAYGVYDNESYDMYYYYGVFSYTEEKGFQPLAYIAADKDMAEEYEDYLDLRGIYAGDTFYLTGNYGIKAYDMGNDFEEKAVLYWEKEDR